MFLKRVRIQNFRSIRDCRVEFGAHTAILGGNGAGKSTILRAIERFYAANSTVELDDFFGRAPDKPIEIELTFSGLNEEELDLFGSRVHADEMSVARVFEVGAGRNNGKYYGKSKQHIPFAAIRSVAGAAERKGTYDALRTNGNYADLQSVRRADQIEDQLSTWEAAHPEACGLAFDNGQFFGFTNVARGSLQRFTSFVFIPAVRDASADAVDAKGAVIARLMELVVRSAIQRRADIREFQATVTRQYRELTDPARLTELGDLSGSLTETIQRLYLEAAVNVRWREAGEFPIPLPAADVLIDDDGFEGPVDRKGHGLQRAFILTLLQHLAHASAESARSSDDIQLTPVPNEFESERSERLQPEMQPEISDADPLPTFMLPGLILAIEEPELYQHPTKQRHFANVLRSLSEGSVPGVAAQTQVIFASHSSLFVGVDRFDEIRLARRRPSEGLGHKECFLTSSSLPSICRSLEVAFGEAEGTRIPDGLRSRLHVLGQELSEGFFADLVVLVEGASDRAAITAASALAQFDLAANGVAVLPVTGKTGLMNPACIFHELEVPTFVVWDCDSGSDDPKVAYNRALQRVSGVAEPYIADYLTAVRDRFAMFEVDLETTIRSEIGSANYDSALDDARQKFGLHARNDVSKSPAAMTDVLREVNTRGQTSKTLQSIVEAIQALRSSQQVIAVR